MNNSEKQSQTTYWVDLIDSQVYQIRGRYRTRILEAGDSGNPPLILLHGTGGHLENYARNIPALAKHFHVIAMDFIWHGRSQTDGFNLEIIPTLVDQVLDVMECLGIEQASIGAQSMGGWVAMQLAINHPDKVDRLILTTTMGYKPDPASIPGYVEPDWTANLPASLSMLNDPSFDNVRTRMGRILARPELLTDEAVQVRQAIYQKPELRDVQLKFITEYLTGNVISKHLVTDELAARIRQPVLVYWGDKNRTPPAFGQHLADTVQNGRFHCAENTGHWAQFESAPEHNRVVTDFLLEPRTESMKGESHD